MRWVIVITFMQVVLHLEWVEMPLKVGVDKGLRTGLKSVQTLAQVLMSAQSSLLVKMILIYNLKIVKEGVQ